MSEGGHGPSTERQTHDPQPTDNELVTAASTANSTARNSPQIHTMSLTQEGAEGSRSPTQPSAAPNSESQPQSEPQQAPPEMPQTQLTFLLVSGRRKTMSFEPEITIGRVKELVWNAWPSDWKGEQPPAPAYLRILHLGKILQDEDTLNTTRFRPNPAPPTIVHLSVRQIPIPSDSADALKKNKKRSRIASSGGENQTGEGNGQDEAGCCGCVIC